MSSGQYFFRLRNNKTALITAITTHSRFCGHADNTLRYVATNFTLLSQGQLGQRSSPEFLSNRSPLRGSGTISH